MSPRPPHRRALRFVGRLALSATLTATSLAVPLTLGAARASEFTLAPPERYRLENGLEVILSPDRRQPKVAVVMSYRVGSRDDPQGYSGLAHMVEHMTFRGSRHVPALEMLTALERIGARSANAGTHPDWTAYYSVVPPTRVPLVLWLESERMAFTLESMNDESFAAERSVVLNERRERKGLGSRIPEYVNRALYPEAHPYARVFDDRLDETAFELDHVRWFFQHWYRPDNATLTLVGDFDVTQVKEAVDQYFSAVRAVGPSPARTRAAPVALAGQAALDIRVPDRRDRAKMVWLAPCVIAECGHELLLLQSLLAGTSESPLRAELVGPGRLASDLSISIDPYETHTRMTLRVDATLGVSIDRVVEAIDRVLTRAQSEPLEAAELQDAKISLRTAIVTAFEPVLSRAFALTHFRRRGADAALYDPNTELARIGALEADDVRAAARRYLPLDRRVVVYERRARSARGEGQLARTEGRALPAEESAR